MENYDRLIQLAYQNWQYHFEFLNLGYLAYLDFFGFCKEVFPGIPDQSIAKMVQGVDMELFRPDDELKKLAELAVELACSAHFADTDDVAGHAGRDRAPRRRRTGSGSTPYEAAQDPWFNFTVGNGFYGHDKYWNEHQEIPLGYIADYIRRLDDGPGDHAAGRGTDRGTRPHHRGVPRPARGRDTRPCSTPSAGSPPPPTRTWRTTTSTSSTGPWASSGARSASCRAVLQAEGFWTEPDDLLYLSRNEVRDALFDLVTGWGVGATPIGPDYWPAEIERRRGIIDALSRPPARSRR